MINRDKDGGHNPFREGEIKNDDVEDSSDVPNIYLNDGDEESNTDQIQNTLNTKKLNRISFQIPVLNVSAPDNTSEEDNDKLESNRLKINTNVNRSNRFFESDIISPQLYVTDHEGESSGDYMSQFNDTVDDDSKNRSEDSEDVKHAKKDRKRPALSLRIPSFHNPIKVLSPSTMSDKSSPRTVNSNQIDGRLRSQSSNSRHTSRPMSTYSSDGASSASRVISFIGPNDLEEYEDLQKEFRSAVDEKGFTWLPQLNDEQPINLSPEEDTSFIQNPPSPGESNAQSNLGLNIFSQNNSSILDNNNSINITAKDEKKSFFNIKSEQNEEHVEEILETENNVSDSEEVELPNFEDFFDGNQYNNLKLYGNSLGFFAETSYVRLKLAKLHVNRKYNAFYYLLLVLFTILLSYRTFNPTDYDFLYHFNSPPDVINFILCIFFSVHDISKIIAFGFWDDSQMFAAHSREYISIIEWIGLDKFYKRMRKRYGAIVDVIIPLRLLTSINDYKNNIFSLTSSVTQYFENEKKPNQFDCPRAFARSSWNRNDLVATICFWVGLFLSINNLDRRVGINIFRTLAVLRILRLLDTDTGISSVLRALKVGLPQLISVGSMLVYFWTFFGILGVQIFHNSLRRQCVWVNPDNPNDTYHYDMQFCGGYLDTESKSPLNYIFENGDVGPNSKGFLCPVNSKCISNANPYNGRVSFDNIVNSMELIFVIMSSNTFTDMMYYTMDSEEMAASLFFIVSTIVLTIWMLNIFLAVLVSSFEIADAQFREKKAKTVQSIKSVPHRLFIGYWKYFQFKGTKLKPSLWIQRSLEYYKKTEFLFIILIFIDLIVRALPTANSSVERLNELFKIEKVITIILFIEAIMILMLHSSNLWKYFTTITNPINLLTAIVTFTVTLIHEKYDIGQVYQWLSIFQISRIYRIIIHFNFSRKLWRRVLNNYGMVWDLTAFYFLFIFLASIIVSVFFEGYIPPSEVDDLAFGMYGLINSFISLFIIGSTENWTEILYDLQDHAPNISSAIFTSILLIMWFIVSNFVILNIFIAIISRSFFVKEDEKRYLQIRHYLRSVYPKKLEEYTHATLLKRLKRKIFKKKDVKQSDFKQFLIRGTAIMNIANNMENLMEDLNKNIEEGINFTEIKRWIINLPIMKFFPFFRTNPFYYKKKVIYMAAGEKDDNYMLQLDDHELEKIEYLKQYPTFNYSYFIFPPNHRLRLFCQKLVPPSVGNRTDGIRFYDDTTNLYNKRSYFHNLQRDIVTILVSIATVLLVLLSCYVTPLYRIGKPISRWGWENVCEYIFLAIFTIEFIIKTIADGFVYAPNAYLRNPWNGIDFTVLVSLYIDLIATLKQENELAKGFKGLSALRALRCLTISNTARETFVVVVYDGIGKIFEASLVSLTLLYPFTIWGLNLFRGRLATCNDGNVDMVGCFNEYSSEVFKWDILTPRVYANPILHLDSFSSAFRSMYEIISLEGWTDLLSNLMNTSGIGSIPSPFATAGNGTFLIIFNFLSMVFILNLFVSFVINNHARTMGTAFQTSAEKSWLESKKILSQVSPDSFPEIIKFSKFRRILYNLTVEKKNLTYSSIINLTLYIHVIFLLCISSRDSVYSTSFTLGYFMFSSTVLTLHEITYLCAMGFKCYIKNPWPSVRLFLTFFSFLFTLILLISPKDNYWFRNIAQVFQLMIFLFLIPQSDMLTELLQTGMASLPSLLSLLYTWGILFLAYAIALNQIFGATKLGPNTTGNLNFRTVIKAMIVLFRCSFGEGWNYIMNDLILSEPLCYSDSGLSDCGSRPYAYLLLISWNLLSMYIFINMVISLVVSNFSYVYRRGDTKSAINRNEIRKFTEAWSKYDSNGRGILGIQYLPKLMQSFDGPLSFKIWEGRLRVKNLIKNYMVVNPDDPYDIEIDLDGLNKELNSINREKVILRKNQYRRFIQEAFHNNSYRGSISFSDVLNQIPLYTVYNPRECLGIDEYVKHLYVMGKVDKYLENQHHIEVLSMVVTKWKYILKKRHNYQFGDTNPFSNAYEMKTDKNVGQTVSVEENTILPMKTPAPEFVETKFNWPYLNSPEKLNERQFKRTLVDRLEHIETDDGNETDNTDTNEGVRMRRGSDIKK